MFMVNLQFVNLQFGPEFPLSNFQIPSLLLVHAEAVFIHKEYSDKLRECLSGVPSTVLLKNSRFVSGHRFSDAASCSKSDWLLAQSAANAKDLCRKLRLGKLNTSNSGGTANSVATFVNL
jgi:hypothetical protein